MNADEVERERNAIIQKYGEWTAHNIALTKDIYTIAPSGSVSPKLQRILQIVSDLSPKPISQLRILDLACLEGQYAIEFALHGAKAVAVEGREANIEKARLAKRALSLGNLELLQGDVRDLSTETHGKFDVVLCLGILYHIDAPDVFSLVEKISATCERFAVFDTYISLSASKAYTYNGHTYHGRDIQEHDGNVEAAKQVDLWSALHNSKSAWLTKATLCNLLMRAGFTSVYDCDMPFEPAKPLDRVTLVAIKGAPAKILSSNLPTSTDTELPENWRRRASSLQRPMAQISKRVTKMVPNSVKRTIKDRLRALGVLHYGANPWEWPNPFRSREDRST